MRATRLTGFAFLSAGCVAPGADKPADSVPDGVTVGARQQGLATAASRAPRSDGGEAAVPPIVPPMLVLAMASSTPAHAEVPYDERLLPSSSGAGDQFGHALASAGDVDADGYPDLAVSAWGSDVPAPDAGAVYVYYGAKGGIDGAREDRLVAFDAAENNFLGAALAGAGDVDGDG